MCLLFKTKSFKVLHSKDTNCMVIQERGINYHRHVVTNEKDLQDLAEQIIEYYDTESRG